MTTGVDRAVAHSLSTLSRIEGDTWIIPQSGGKDSRTTGQMVLALIEDGRLSPPARLVFYLADTLMEFASFDVQARAGLTDLADKAKKLGIETHGFTTMPIPQDDFWVRIVGYGFVPPTAKMRTCTDKLKITPPRKILRQHGWAEAPLLLGVRRGESDRRDEILSCTGGGECGPDLLYLRLKQKASSAQRAVAPIIDWRTCDVWDWLTLVAPRYGFDNARLIEAYGPGGNLRYGCWSCPLVFNDGTGEYLAQRDPKIRELIKFTDTVLRKGGAAWQTENREALISLSGEWLSDGRLSLSFCHRIFAWLLAFEERWDYPLLSDWQKGMIEAIWTWRESLPTPQAGEPGQMEFKLGGAC